MLGAQKERVWSVGGRDVACTGDVPLCKVPQGGCGVREKEEGPSETWL